MTRTAISTESIRSRNHAAAAIIAACEVFAGCAALDFVSDTHSPADINAACAPGPDPSGTRISGAGSLILGVYSSLQFARGQRRGQWNTPHPQRTSTISTDPLRFRLPGEHLRQSSDSDLISRTTYRASSSSRSAFSQSDSAAPCMQPPASQYAYARSEIWIWVTSRGAAVACISNSTAWCSATTDGVLL